MTDDPSSSGAAEHQTELSEHRTTLGAQRTFLAFERTLMAWLRTSLSLISFGFTIAKFFQYLAEERGGTIVGPLGRAWASDTVGLLMIAIGTFTMILAVVQHRRRVAELRPYGLVPQWNLALWVSAAITVLGVFAFFTLLLAW
jgi:putative membrane protein